MRRQHGARQAGEGIASPTDVLLLALAAFQVVGTYFAARDDQPDRIEPDGVGIILLVAGPLALFARRRNPVAVLLVVLAVTLTYLGLGYAYGPVFLSMVIALYTAVVQGHRRAAWLAAGALLGGHAGIEYLAGRRNPVSSFAELIAVLSWLLVVLVVSEIARVRTERRAEAARTLEEEALRRASEERLRIARELHDVIAHNISLINVQAGVALHLIDEQPEQARSALAAIKIASKDVLREVRATLGVLRSVDEEPPRNPSPTLSRLAELTAAAEAAGHAVHVRTSGEPRPLPAAVDAAAFRIVQEALTNVTRHAASADATVTIGYGERELTLEIEDNGAGTSGTASVKDGHGIVGMRERAAALGGTLEAGPRPGGGFRVHARLPFGNDR